VDVLRKGEGASCAQDAIKAALRSLGFCDSMKKINWTMTGYNNGELTMTATIELNDRLISKAKKLSGITNEQDLVSMTITHYLEGAEIRVAAAKAKEAAWNENPFWDGYDPKA
jgi:hypothetical protein